MDVRQIGISMVIVDNKNMPMAMMLSPTIASIRYLPVQLTIWPEMILNTIEANMRGSMALPLLVALCPCTPCMNRGRLMMAPNNPKPTSVTVMIDRLNMRLLKRSSGIIGSAALASRQMNRPRNTTLNTNIVMIGGESR